MLLEVAATTVWDVIRKNAPLVAAVFTILSAVVGSAIRIEHRLTVLEQQYHLMDYQMRKECGSNYEQ
jgi:hypothetical protein